MSKLTPEDRAALKRQFEVAATYYPAKTYVWAKDGLALLSALEEAEAGWKHAIEALAENVNSRQEETVRAEKSSMRYRAESAALRAEVERMRGALLGLVAWCEQAHGAEITAPVLEAAEALAKAVEEVADDGCRAYLDEMTCLDRGEHPSAMCYACRASAALSAYRRGGK